MNNARFWVYVNGTAVKLTLMPGQQLAHVEGGATDEGYSIETRVWEYDIDTLRVFATSHVRACDCDGPIEHYSQAACVANRENLQGGYSDPDYTIAYPAWQQISASQRDHYAEAMGY